eukprot:2030964-Pyramimonas_sp.AAC.1
MSFGIPRNSQGKPVDVMRHAVGFRIRREKTMDALRNPTNVARHPKDWLGHPMGVLRIPIDCLKSPMGFQT